MIAVCFLTCGREWLSEKTAASFVKHNSNRSDLVLMHCDGGPSPDRNSRIARDHGFSTLWESRGARVGQMATFRRFMTAVIGDPRIELMCWLENDWDSAAPLPSIEFFRGWPLVQQFRMYGVDKMRAPGPRQKAGTKRLGTDELLQWKHASHGWEIVEQAHWAAGGTVTRIESLRPFMEKLRLKDVIVGANELRTVRPTKNIMWHIGDDTTEGFVG